MLNKDLTRFMQSQLCQYGGSKRRALLSGCIWLIVNDADYHFPWYMYLLILFCLLFIFTAVASTSHFQKALLGLSVFALMAQIIFQIVLGALPPYGHFFPNCKFRLVLVNTFFWLLLPQWHIDLVGPMP